MILKILDEPIDPYYSSMTQTFVGVNAEDCWNQKCEFEKWLRRYRITGIIVYRDKILD